MNPDAVIKAVVVDDNPATLYSTGRILESASYDVVRCARGSELFAAVDEATEVVVLDINLPDIDGIEICRRLRAKAETRQLAIIHLTATKIGDRDRVEGLDAGADAYLTHPVHPQVLLATVRTLLRARDAEKALRGSEANLRGIFDQAPCGIAVLDPKFRFVSANPEMQRLLRRESQDIHGHSIFDFSAESANVEGAVIAAAMDAGRAWTGIIRITVAPGEIIDLEWNISRREDGDAYLCIVADVTQRARIEAQREQMIDEERGARVEAERVVRVKDEFLATLSHELRNPLAPMKNSLYLLEVADPSSESAQKARAVLSRQVNHMIRLVDDLVDVSRITRGLVGLDMRAVPLRSLIDSALEASLPQIRAAGHQVSVHVDAGDSVIEVDPLRMSQVLTNILNNAAKYTPAGGTIGVRARIDADVVEIAVEDSGIGIPEDMIERIFDVFTQINPTGPHAAGGLGIGLTLVRRLVEMHGGRVAVFSRGAGHGSRFVVTLPRRNAAASAPAAPEQGDETRPSHHAPRRAVIIDDNRDSAESLCELLTALGHDCRSFFDGPSGIRGIETFMPDLAFIDIGMPHMDGHEVARRLKGSPATRHVLLFALTGWDQKEERARSLESGFDRHLTKPISLADLERAVDAQLDRAADRPI
jgi:PAS domain S-box-containing protein